MKKFLSATTVALVSFIGITAFVKPTQALDESKRTKVSQEIVDNLVTEKYDEVRKDFDERLKQSLPVEKISEVWAQTISTYGKFTKVISVSPASDRGYNQIKMRLQFEKGKLTQETTFSEDDKVIGMWIKP